MRLNRCSGPCAGMILAMFGFLVGCGETPPTTPTGKTGDAKDHKVDENKHVGHEHGPNGGEVVELKNGNEEFHIEWDHDDTGLVTFYLLDKDLKNVAETDAAEITIESKVGDKETKYTLPRVESESKTAKTSKFELSDKALMTSLLAPEGVTNTLKISIGGKEFSAAVKHDPAHEHH
jgi:hypothetical protein